MTFSQFYFILAARWRAVWVTFLLVMLAVCLITFLSARKYSAMATVVVDVRPDPLSAMAFQMGGNPAAMGTQIDIIRSDRVARRVVRGLRLTEVESIRASWRRGTNGEGDIETWLVRLMAKELVVEPARDTNVLRIEYEAESPQFAALVANAFAQAYLDTTVELRVEPARQFSAFFDARAKEARDRLEEAQTRLSAFQRENGLVMTDERLDVENTRLNELSSQLVALGAVSAESRSRQAQAVAGAGDKLQEVTNNPVVASLRSDLSRQEARLQEISARLGERHPQVQELRANINELRQRLDQEVKRLSAGVGVSDSISRSREAQIRAELDAQRTRVLKLKAVRDEGLVIQRDVDSAQRHYDQVLGRLSQVQLESQATAANVSMLSPAVPSIEPSSPKVLLNLAIGVFLGGLLAVGVALLREMLDRRIRTLDDIVSALQLPVLGVMPGSGGSGADSAAGRKLAHWRQRVLRLGRSAA